MGAYRIAMLAALLVAADARATQADPASAQARWEVDYGDRQCRLSRTTGGADPVVLSFRLDYMGENMGAVLINPSWTFETSLARRVDIVLHPGGERWSHDAGDERVPDRGYRFLRINAMDASLLDGMARSESFALEAEGRELFRLDIPEAERAVRALRDCNDDLLRGWGVDVAQLRAVRERPRMTRRWATHNDYPADALRRRVSGTVVVRFTVGVNGRVTDCAVLESSGDEGLDRGTCALARQRGRYSPAIGADGAPVPFPIVMQVRWRIF